MTMMPPPPVADPAMLDPQAMLDQLLAMHPQPGQSPYTMGYWMAKIAPNDPTGSRRRYVLREVQKFAGADFHRKHDAMWSALGRVPAPPAVRLLNFRQNFKPQRWQELYLRFPRRFDELWSDYQDLEARWSAGEEL